MHSTLHTHQVSGYPSNATSLTLRRAVHSIYIRNIARNIAMVTKCYPLRYPLYKMFPAWWCITNNNTHFTSTFYTFDIHVFFILSHDDGFCILQSAVFIKAKQGASIKAMLSSEAYKIVVKKIQNTELLERITT